LLRDARVAFLRSAPCDRCQLLRGTLEGFGVPSSGKDLVAMRDQLRQVAAEERRTGRRSVLILDDAHQLGTSSLREVELLSSLGTASPNLVQVVLAGLPSLTETLQGPGLAAFRQRMTLVPGLDPLSPADTARYVDHRLRIAGYNGAEPLFTAEALKRVAAATGGVPRRIDVVCRRALTLASARGVTRINRAIVDEAIASPGSDRLESSQAPDVVSVEQPLEPLPMAVGQGSMLLWPTTARPTSASRDALLEFQAEKPQTPVSATSAPVPAGPRAGFPCSVSAASRSSRRGTLVQVTPTPADAAPESPEAPTVVDVTWWQEKRPPITDTPITYTQPVDSPQLSQLVQSLLSAQNDPVPRSILFACVDQGAQTAQLCADVGKVLAAAGTSRILVVDADRDSSALHEQFGVSARPGLTEVLDGCLSIEDAVVPVGPRLSVLTFGLVTHSGASCLLPDPVADLMSELRSRFDYILINGTPLAQGSDSEVLGKSTDGVLLVVAAHATRRAVVRQLKARLETAGVRLLGAVLTERTFPIPDAIYRRL
jgi:Mrp family chromosome partitioning ATPase